MESSKLRQIRVLLFGAICILAVSIASGSARGEGIPDSLRAEGSAWGPRLALGQQHAQGQSGGVKEARQLALGVAKSALDGYVGQLLQDAPDWAKRIEFGWTVSEDEKPEFTFLTVQPLYQSENSIDTVFTQGRVAHGRRDRTTLNLGLGYRRLFMDNKMMLGANAFFDYEAPYDHQRAGFGLEVRSLPVELTGNVYRALSGQNVAESGWLERALDGEDIELGFQVPYLPWARAYARKFRWDGVDGRDIDGERLALRLRPWGFIEVEAGYQDDNVNDSSFFGMLRLSLALGRVPSVESRGLIDDVAFRYDDVSALTLDKVRRQNTIVVERVSSAPGSATVTVSRGS